MNVMNALSTCGDLVCDGVVQPVGWLLVGICAVVFIALSVYLGLDGMDVLSALFVAGALALAAAGIFALLFLIPTLFLKIAGAVICLGALAWGVGWFIRSK